jgi:hypothetical protein
MILEVFEPRKKKTGPVAKALEFLRTIVVTVKLTVAEANLLDQKRGHHTRSAWLRAAGLDMVLSAPLTNEWQTTWQESARIAACLTQINNLASRINSTILAEGEAAAVSLLLAELADTRDLLAEFRASISVSK